MKRLYVMAVIVHCWPKAYGAESASVAAGFSPRWSVELRSGVLWSNVRDRNIPGCNLIPLELSMARSIHWTCLENMWGGVLESRPEAVFNLHWTQMERGVENHLAGFSGGLRYNLVRLAQPVAPFVEATVGAAWADSQPYELNGCAYGLGQDFNFNFNLAWGIRWSFTDRWFARTSMVYQHYSNAGMSEPEHLNRAIDALGFMISFGTRF